MKHQQRHDQLPPCRSVLLGRLQRSRFGLWYAHRYSVSVFLLRVRLDLASVSSSCTYVRGVVFLLCLGVMLGWKRLIGERCRVRSAFVNLVAYALVGWFRRILRRLPPRLIPNILRHHLQRDLHQLSHDKVYLTFKPTL